MDFRVDGKRYVNLDNAATTSPLKAVEDGVEKYLTTYGSVHRGSGEKSRRILCNLFWQYHGWDEYFGALL